MIYNVGKLTSAGMLGSTQVAISTIQRVFKALKHEDVAEGDDPGLDGYVLEAPVTVACNRLLPPETFDRVIVDEAHRSMYGVWRGVAAEGSPVTRRGGVGDERRLERGQGSSARRWVHGKRLRAPSRSPAPVTRSRSGHRGHPLNRGPQLTRTPEQRSLSCRLPVDVTGAIVSARG